MSNKKYEMVGWGNCCGLSRIRALRDFGDVKKGDVGGWIRSESNLSHDGDCWIFDNARVYENAHVYGNALIWDAANIYGDAQVSGNAWVYGHARVSGNAVVTGTL